MVSLFMKSTFRAPPPTYFQMTDSTVTNVIEGTPKRAVISDSTIASLNPGAYAYGRSDETVYELCNFRHRREGRL